MMWPKADDWPEELNDEDWQDIEDMLRWYDDRWDEDDEEEEDYSDYYACGD